VQTHLADFIKNTPQGDEAEEILRRCVHCGFCTATCPTYQLLGDELDGPRGRIYLIKQVLEGAAATAKTQLHLDRCLTCRSCESTCPSGVQYGRLLDIGREVVEKQLPRTGAAKLLRATLRELVPRPALFGKAMKLGQLVRPLLPGSLKAKVPPASSAGKQPQQIHDRKMLALAGCAQPAMYPNINGATRRVLDKLGISLIEPAGQGCCGAVRHHLSAREAADDDARRNIDAWWPLIEAGAEAVVITASGCGTHVREYSHLLQHDPAYAYKAARVSLLTKDISEVVAAELEKRSDLLQKSALAARHIAVHNPCSLQHGMQLRGLIERILLSAGAELTPVADGHLCCGSAGTYSILQADISKKLHENKLKALTAGKPDVIVSANVGCISHLGSGNSANIPVRHWIEVIDEALHDNPA
jgi:glycolate oxidase iron-sulfur subunit